MGLFDDMLTSYRGAGVIGTFMGVFVLGGFVLLSVFAFDPQYNGSVQSLDGLIASQEREIAQLERQLNEGKSRYERYLELKAKANALAEIREENRERRKKLDKLARLQERVGDAGVRIDAEAATYVRKYREQVRSKAVGESIGKLVMVDGRTIENATISQVTPAGIHLRHADGIQRIPANELPADLRDRFQFDDAEMEDFLNRERAELGRMEEGIDAGVEDGVRLGRIKYLDRRIPMLTNRLVTYRNNLAILRKQRRPDAKLVRGLQQQITKDQTELKELQRELAKLKKGVARQDE